MISIVLTGGQIIKQTEKITHGKCRINASALNRAFTFLALRHRVFAPSLSIELFVYMYIVRLKCNGLSYSSCKVSIIEAY